MKTGRAVLFGVVGAGTMSVLSAILRAVGVPIRLEILLGTLGGDAPSTSTFLFGLAIHLAIGGLFGLLYGALFEHVWSHGGASTGMIFATLHAALIGMLVGLTPQFHPLVPEQMASPGPYFSHLGTIGVVTFFALHLIYGAIVGGGYGHIPQEREWAPAGRL